MLSGPLMSSRKYEPFQMSVFCVSGESMVAMLKLEVIDGKAPPGVEPAAKFDSTREHSPGSDVASGCLFLLAQCPIRTHFCVVQCYSQLGWPVIKGGKPIWNPDPHHGFVDAFLFSAIWYAHGGKRGLERPGLDVAVTALAGGELTVGDEFWARHGENGVTSDAHLEAFVACKNRVCWPEFRWLPQALPQSVAKAHTLLLNVHYAERMESDAVRSLRMESWHPQMGRGHLR